MIPAPGEWMETHSHCQHVSRRLLEELHLWGGDAIKEKDIK